MIRHHSFSHTVEGSGRLDATLSAELDIQRSVFSLPSVVILLNGKNAKKSAKVKEGDEVNLEYDEEVFEGLDAEDIPLTVLYEDDSILVIDKPQGMVVHPGAGVHSGTVVNALLSRYGDDFASSDDERPGIVHRLDKDTSGVMVIARTPSALEKLQSQFFSHETEKHYKAIAKGTFCPPHGFIDTNIERDPKDRKKFRATDREDRGKKALTEYTVEKILSGYTLVDIHLHTGRTHQIRVHLSSTGHPILGDPVYGVNDPRYPDSTLMLHAFSLEINHPETGERMHFESELPERFKRILPILEGV